jgi:hypothetical protein
VTDEDYHVEVHGDQLAYLQSRSDGGVDPATIWIFRFYDKAASTFDVTPETFVIEQAADELFELLRLVRAKTSAPRVNLVAHSMGGLICRSLIQRVIPEATHRPDAAAEFVDRFFTYATPHGGIEFRRGYRWLEKARDLFNIHDTEIFGRERMYQYLMPDLPDRPRRLEAPDDWKPARMPPDGFPLDRVFCLVGTNPDDFEVAMGVSSRAVGAKSDGLVQIDNAFVPGAYRSYVHRSHSGRYGIVNSEEGYQNLRRFMFGSLEVAASLVHIRLVSDSEDLVWQLEAQVAIRGLPTLIHDRSAAHYCPIPIGRHERDTGEIPLFTTFLMGDDGTQASGLTDGLSAQRHTLHVRLISLEQRGGVFRFGQHLEQTADFDDTLVVDVFDRDSERPARAWARWGSQIPGSLREWRRGDDDELHSDEEATSGGLWRASVPLPDPAGRILGPEARLALAITTR